MKHKLPSVLGQKGRKKGRREGGTEEKKLGGELIPLLSLAGLSLARGLARKPWLIFLNHIPCVIDPFLLGSYSIICSQRGW